MNKHKIQIYIRCVAVAFLFCWLTCDSSSVDPLVVNCSFPGLEHCGQNWCCCDTKPRGVRKALCVGHGRLLQYIPALPKNIKAVFFENNYLPNVSKSTFSNISHLNVMILNLNNDSVSNITADAFSQLNSLQSLIVNNNENLNIESFHVALQMIPSIKRLEVGNTNLESIDDLFHGLRFQKLETLHIGQNFLGTLNTNMFNFFPNLKWLSARKCSLNEFKTELNPRKLIDLDLSDNFLSPDIPDFCHNRELNRTFVSSSIVSLHLQNNDIKYIKANHIKCLKHLKNLYLQCNYISVIEANIFPQLPNIKHLNLKGMKVRLKRIEKGAFDNSKLESLLFSGNRYEFKDDGIFDGLVGLKLLDISRNRMFDINESRLMQLFKPLENIEHLNMAQVHMSYLKNDFLRMFPKLNVLYAEGNYIKSLHGSFRSIKTIKEVNLRRNLLAVIKQEDFPLIFLKAIERIDLSANPFDCTCELLWFRKWINKINETKRISLVNWPKFYRCHSPPTLYDRHILEYNPTDKSCASSDSLVIVSVLCIVFSIVFIVVINLVLYKRRWYMRYWIYKLKRRKKITDEQIHLLEDSGILYDGYVIYHDGDSDFVHKDMIDLFEKKHHQNIHSWHRNAQSGPRLEVMFDAIYSSRRVLAVISSKSLEDRYFKFQLMVAMDRMIQLNKKCVLLILLEDINFKALNNFWCATLTKLPTAAWCQESENIKREIFEQDINEFFNLNYDV